MAAADELFFTELKPSDFLEDDCRTLYINIYVHACKPADIWCINCSGFSSSPLNLRRSIHTYILREKQCALLHFVSPAPHRSYTVAHKIYTGASACLSVCVCVCISLSCR